MGWTISSSVEGPRLIILCIPRVQNRAGSQRTFTQLVRALGLAPHGRWLGWADNRKETGCQWEGCQQLRGALKSKGSNSNARGRADASVLCPRPATGLRLSVQTHPADGPGATEPSRPCIPLPADSLQNPSKLGSGGLRHM